MQSVPTYSPTQIVQMVKSITARQIFRTAKQIFRRVPSVKQQLWGGAFWSSGFYIDTVIPLGGTAVRKLSAITSKSKAQKKSTSVCTHNRWNCFEPTAAVSTRVRRAIPRISAATCSLSFPRSLRRTSACRPSAFGRDRGRNPPRLAKARFPPETREVGYAAILAPVGVAAWRDFQSIWIKFAIGPTRNSAK